MLAALLLTVGVPEIVVRVLNPTLDQYRGVEFGHDAGSEKLFKSDRRLTWTLRPETEVTFLDTDVRVNRQGFRGGLLQPTTHKVLCVGDSTTFGWAVEEWQAYPARLERALNSAGREYPWQVINAGVPGFSSYQVRQSAEDLIRRWKPKAVVVCAGNNDGWPAVKSDAEISRGRARVRPLSWLLGKSRFVAWLRATLGREQQIPTDLSAAVPRVSEDEYAGNIRSIVATARAEGAAVVLVTPPVNLDFFPKRLQHFPDWSEWSGWWGEMKQRIERGEAGDVLAEIRTRRQESPDKLYPIWLEGMALTRLGETRLGIETLEEALDRHPFPERAKRSYRRRLVELARSEGVGLVEADKLLLDASLASRPTDWFVDWCHPTADGHALLAGEILDQLERQLASAGR